MNAPSAFERLVFRRLPLACMLLAAAAGLVLGPAWSARVAALPWIVSLAVVGLPHGAADLAIARRLGSGPSAVRMFAFYLAGMAAVFAGFALFPVPLILLFAAVSVWHFGMGHADGQVPPIQAAVWPRLRAAVGRGAVVLGVPLACWPAETSAVAQRLVGLAGGDPLSAAGWFAPAAIRLVGIAILAATAVAQAAELLAARREPGEIHRSLETLVDTAVIALLGMATDPLFSVGVYFLVWHAWRHLWLVSPVVTGVRPVDWPSLGRAVARLHLAALPLLIPTWAAVLAGWWWLSADHSARDLAILSLGVYLVVTPSHDLLIDLLRGRPQTPAEATPRPAIPSSCAARIAC